MKYMHVKLSLGLFLFTQRGFGTKNFVNNFAVEL